jgi:hypothetical protein
MKPRTPKPVKRRTKWRTLKYGEKVRYGDEFKSLAHPNLPFVKYTKKEIEQRKLTVREVAAAYGLFRRKVAQKRGAKL